MKKIGVILLLLSLCLVGCLKTKVNLNNKNEKLSYSMGFNIGENLANNFKSQEIEVNVNALSQGLADAFNENGLLSTTDMKEVLMSFQKEKIAKQQETASSLKEMNLKSSQAFLAQNRSKNGIVELSSGLQYKILKSGSGKSPKATDKVTVHYKGSLLDGQEFDSSYKRNTPATFQVGGVIPGWTEALQKMRVGDKWKLFIPPNLGYGERGAGKLIQPNSTLIFEVELLSISK